MPLKSDAYSVFPIFFSAFRKSKMEDVGKA